MYKEQISYFYDLLLIVFIKLIEEKALKGDLILLWLISCLNSFYTVWFKKYTVVPFR